MHVFSSKRMENLRYVALQFAHLALAQHPVLQEKSFPNLQELCPELCEEDCSLVEYHPGIVLKPFILPETNSLHLNNGGWGNYILFGIRPIFRCKLLVSGRVNLGINYQP